MFCRCFFIVKKEYSSKLIGKCGKTLCSKEYNKHVSDVVVIAKYVIGSEAYGKVVRYGLNLVALKLNKDLDKGIKDNDYIKSEHIENIKKCVKDLEKCGEKKYNLINKADKLDWFVGGDFDKILRLQRKINSQNLGIKVEEDVVCSDELEKAWVWYVEEYIKLAIMPIPMKVKYAFDNYNFVAGIGIYGSYHKIIGGTLGVMIYIDDDYNIAIMRSKTLDTTSDFEYSIGMTGELSLDADKVVDMEGNSLSFGGGISTPIEEIGINAGYSRSIGDGSVNSFSLGVSYGKGIVPFGATVGTSVNTLILQFNPVEYIRKTLVIR